MSRAVVLAKPLKIQIGNIIDIDACIEETHELSNTVTDHPVEQGFNISDHSRPDPDVVTLRCFVSNTPLSTEQTKTSVKEGAVSFDTTAPEVIGNRGKDTFDKLKKLRDDGTLIAVVTTLKTYAVSSTEGMIVQKISIPRTTKNYDGLEFSMTLKQIRIVLNKQTSAPAKDKRVSPKKNKGTQNGKEFGPELLRSKARSIQLGLQ